MATTLETLTLKTQEQVRDDYLRTYRNALIKRGISNPDVSQGTEIFQKATALAQQIWVATNGVPAAANAQMPDSALGDDLVRVAAIYKLSPRPAGPSSGPLVLSATINTPIAIPQGAQLLDPSGLSYQVTVAGNYTNGDTVFPIPISSVDSGADTNLPAGTVMRWVAPPPFVNPTAVVGAGGLTGGVDAEDIEGLRARLLQKLQSPPNGVNWPTTVQAAEDSSTQVQKAFAYPACNGPSTTHLAVVRAPTPTNKNRDVDSLVLSNEIVPAVIASFPEFAEVVVTTVQNYEVDVTFGLSLPASTKASPAGPGGGWLDGNPFPVPDYDGTNDFCAVTSVGSSTLIRVPSEVPPTIGGQVCWLSRDDWEFRSAKIVSFTEPGPGLYQISLDTPFISSNGVSVAVGDYIFPHAENMDTYISAILTGFASLGPYEKTNSVSLLPRAYRRPIAATSWYSRLQAPFLRNLSNAGEEVADVSYLYRSATTPPLPTAITDGPYILVPRRIAIYPI